jgi:hypothetical protein
MSSPSSSWASADVINLIYVVPDGNFVKLSLYITLIDIALEQAAHLQAT